MANKLGVTPNTVSRWETATYKPSIDDLDRLGRVFRLPPWAFFPSEIEAPTERHRSLVNSASDLGADEITELEDYAAFIRARKKRNRN